MSDSGTVWRRLRLKPDPTADDHDWQANLVTPNRITAVVGGTTTAGDYVITLTGTVRTKNNAMVSVARSVTFTRAAETDAQIAAALEVLLDAATCGAHTGTTLASVGITASVSSATITLLFPPEAYVTVTTSAPGSATITLPVGATVPITASSPLYTRSGESSVNGATIMLLQKDDAGATLLAPGSSTISVQLIELCEIEDVTANVPSYRYVTSSTAALTGQTFAMPIELPCRGMKFWTVRLTSDASLDANTDSIEVVWRDSVT